MLTGFLQAGSPIIGRSLERSGEFSQVLQSLHSRIQSLVPASATQIPLCGIVALIAVKTNFQGNTNKPCGVFHFPQVTYIYLRKTAPIDGTL